MTTPLRLRARVEGGSGQPRVVVAARDPAELAGRGPLRAAEAHAAVLAAELPGELVFLAPDIVLHVYDVEYRDIAGDVLFVDPRAAVAFRWIRARSRHNTLLVTERCDQLCVMCSQPPKKTHHDLFRFIREAVLLAPRGADIGLSGGEPTLYKDDLYRLVRDVSEARPDVSFHILTNAQHFTPADIPQLRAPPFRNVLWGVPLYSARARAHDEIVGKAGAFDALLDSLSVLMRSAATVELRTVVLAQNHEALPDLARFVGTHLGFVRVWAIMQLENIGYARRRWDKLFFDHSTRFDTLAEAVDLAASRSIPVQLYNFPRCTVPSPYRHLAGATISDWKQRFTVECRECSERA